MRRAKLKKTFCCLQRLDLSSDWPEYEHPGGHHHDPHLGSLHCTGCHVPHHVQKGELIIWRRSQRAPPTLVLTVTRPQENRSIRRNQFLLVVVPKADPGLVPAPPPALCLCRSTRCTAPPAPALSGPSRSSPRASCPTRRCRRPRPTPPPERHKERRREASRSRSDWLRRLSVQPPSPLSAPFELDLKLTPF